ncbi:MAG: response regulator [Desulfobacteraceae bacterium]|nr:MAG: response regulator [Desulfobacteraceae bacterium]
MPEELLDNPDKKTKILIVDDDPAVQTFLTTILSGPRMDIETAVDGFQAGIKVVYFMPQIIILDLFMPYLNGFEVCRHLKEDEKTRHIKILVLTGQASEENKEKVMSAGADAFLPKPSNKAAILQSIDALLAG